MHAKKKDLPYNKKYGGFRTCMPYSLLNSQTCSDPLLLHMYSFVCLTVVRCMCYYMETSHCGVQGVRSVHSTKMRCSPCVNVATA